MWDTNKASRQEACTTYVGHWRPLEYRRVPRLGLPLAWNLNARAKLAGLASTHAPDGNSARKTGSKKETTWGNQSFQKLIRFLYFSGLLIYFLLYIGMKTESCGVSRPDPCQNQVLHINVYKGLMGFTSSSGYEAC